VSAVAELLAHGVGAVTSEWESYCGDALSQAEVRATAEALCRAVAGESDAVPRATPLVRRVLAGLRHAVLHAAAMPAEQVAALRALEDLARDLEPGWAEQFQDRMLGPSGLDLVVEVAHDLRSPLTSILFLAETLLRGRSGPLTTLQERQIGLIYSAAFGLSTVSNDVVDLVRGGDRLLSREPQPFAIGEVLEAVRDIVRPIAEEKELELRIEGPADDRRLGHPGALNRVLLNLTTNALKFTSDGYVEVRVEPRDGDRMHFAVLDTGRGIPPAAMANLYEPFRRRHAEGSYAFSGSGLGLSICRTLVEAMGGTLEVTTASGEGTRFAFDLVLPVAEPGLLIG
jgi:signal transduction histidine kinase